MFGEVAGLFYIQLIFNFCVPLLPVSNDREDTLGIDFDRVIREQQLAGIEIDSTHRVEDRADNVFPNCSRRLQRLIDKRRASKNGIVRRLIIGSFVRIEFCSFQIVQLVELDRYSKTAIQGILFLQRIFHHADVGAGENEFNIDQPIINDVLEDGIDSCGVVHSFEIGVFINDDNDFLRQSIQICEHILQGTKIQWHR